MQEILLSRNEKALLNMIDFKKEIFYKLGFLAFWGVLWVSGVLVEENINPYFLRVIINCGIAIILSLSLNLINGCAGQFSLGHAGFMGIGAYVSSIFTSILVIPFFQNQVGAQVAILIGGVCAAFCGYLVGLPSLRLKGDYLAIVTLGFGEIIRILFLNFQWVGGARGLPGIYRASNFFWVFSWVFFTFIFMKRLIESSHGRAILAVRENEIAAEVMGVKVSQYKILAFCISSFFAGIAGGLFAHFQGFIDPNSFNFSRSVEVVIMVVIGGMGSMSGAVLGAMVVSVVPEILRTFSQYRLVIFPLILILLMILRPKGLLGTKEFWTLWKKARTRTKL